MKNYKILLKIAAVSVIIATLFCFCSCGKKTDVKNAITVEYNGSENHAKPALNINYDELDDLMNAKKAAKYLKKLAKEATKGMDQYEAAFEAMDFYEEDISFGTFFTVDFAKEYSELKNGDEVVVEFNPSSLLERHGQTLKDAEKGTGLSLPKEIKYKVEGLEKAKEIDIFADTSKIIKFSGANGHGNAEIDIDEGYSIEAGNLTIERDYYDEDELVVSIDNYTVGSIAIAADVNEGLKKDDKVTLSASVGSDLVSKLLEKGFVLKREKAEVVVPDLGNATEYDILSKFTAYLKYKGANGYGTAKISIPKNAEFALSNIHFKYSSERSFNVIYDNKDLGSMYFTLTATNELKKGDKVTITIEEGNAFSTLEQKNLYPKEASKEFTVPDLGEFINAAGELTKDDLAKIKQVALKSPADEQGKNVKLEGIWFGVIKDNAADEYNAKGFVSVIYSYSGAWGHTEYAGIDYHDISKNPSGDLNLETTKYFGGLFFDFDGTSESFDQNYTYTKIG